MRQREHSAILSTFIKLPVVIKTFVLSIFQWMFYTGFTVLTEVVGEVNIFFLPVHKNRLSVMTFSANVHDVEYALAEKNIDLGYRLSQYSKTCVKHQ